MKASLKRRAYRYASALLANSMDSVELPDDLTEKEEDEMREFIRVNISDQIAKKGEEPKPRWPLRYRPRGARR